MDLSGGAETPTQGVAAGGPPSRAGKHGDLDPGLAGPLTGPAAPGAVARHVAAGFELFGDVAADEAGLALDLGCSVGRSSFELTRRTSGLVLGLDLNIPMVRLARRVLTTGRVNYRERRVGLVYDDRDFAASLPSPERVDFWAANVLEAPFRAARMGTVAAMNVIDCVPSPATFLHAVERLLAPGAVGILSTPYDWSAGATPYEAWIGGHSQRGPMAGAAEPLIRSLIGGDHAHAARGLELVGEREIEWHVRMHSRSTVLYQCHLMAVRRRA
ncbi:MAG: methyltransferase domain-containing protein [Myxococcales bacterium]|nr:methyltransferase domain-containing protein [Myxococcales bacterium]